MRDNDRIRFVTRALNKELCEQHRRLLPDETTVDYLFGFDGREGVVPFFEEVLGSTSDFRWLCVLDEDAFVLSFPAICELQRSMEQKHLACAGILDGGVIPHRRESPLAFNTCFVLLDLALCQPILQGWQQARYGPDLIDTDLLSSLKLPFRLQSKNHGFYYEPYYRFFYHLRRMRARLLNLPVQQDGEDELATIVQSDKAEAMVLHGWYAREYADQPGRLSKLVQRAAQWGRHGEQLW